MKYKIQNIILCFSLIVISCNKKQESKSKIKLKTKTEYLKSVNSIQRVTLIQTDDRFGEWGGNTSIIKIYTNKRSDSVVADYIELEGNKGIVAPPSPDRIPKPTIFGYTYKSILNKVDKKPLNESDKKLAEDAIIELVQSKISSEQSFSNAGIRNQILFEDSSLVVENYPSIKWNNFQKLKQSILRK